MRSERARREVVSGCHESQPTKPKLTITNAYMSYIPERQCMHAGLRCDEKPPVRCPPPYSRIERRGGAAHRAPLTSFPLDTGGGETRPGVAHLQISTHPPHPFKPHTTHSGSRRRLTATASLAERRSDSAGPARLATPLATDSKRIRWNDPPAVGTSS